MSDTRSRSEIESALSGKQKLYKRKISSNKHLDEPTDFMFDSNSPRRQQVIGGDLTGVSRRRHRIGILSKLSEINLINWLAGLIVALILVAFFWPTKNSQSIREIAEQNSTPNTEPFYTESRIDTPEEPAPSSTSFSRTNDLERANQYRIQEESEKQIKELLISAKQNVSKGQYTRPKDNNALNDYKGILSLDSSNTDARDGINSLKTRFLEIGRTALKSNNEKRALSSLNSLRTINESSSEYQLLSSDIQLWRKNTVISDLLSKAYAAKENQKLILPADESSLYYFQRIIAIDSNNQQAIQGIKSLTDSYISRANASVIEGDLEKATAFLASASIVNPDNPSIDIIRKMIATAEPIAAQTQLNNIINQQSSQAVRPNNNINQQSSSQTTRSNNTTNNRQISDNKTPRQQASESEEFDEIYLTQGLAAYYKGDYDTAAALLKPLADKGISRAQFRIGYMHYLGRGFAKNTIEADKLFRSALPAIQRFANEGRSWAQSDLGSLYEDGLVLPRNYTEAIFWYRSAAEQGYPGAQTNLGIMYARGRGVTTSRQTAIQWFQRAAKQGDIAAQRNLESLGAN